MKDWQMGFMPADDDALLGNAYSDNEVTDFGLGAPQRVLDEWERRYTARIEAERARTQLLRSRRVNTRCMTDGDAAGLMPKHKVFVTPLVEKIVEQLQLQYEFRKPGQPVPVQYATAKWRQLAQLQAQQNQAVQNAYTDGLLQWGKVR